MTPARRLHRAAAFLGIATLVANVLGYGFFLILSRALTPGDLGAVGSLLNVAVIGMLPALALQLVVARTVATASHGLSKDSVDDTVRAALRLAVLVGIVTAVIVAALSVPLARVLHLDGPTGPLLIAATLIPTAALCTGQGLLQGEELFGRLAAAYITVGLLKFGAGAGAAWLDLGANGALALNLLGTAIAAAVAVAAVPRVWRVLGVAGRPVSLAGLVARSTIATSGLLVLSSVDLILARHYLGSRMSGDYTVGAIFTKAALWGPAFLATVYFPGMAIPARRRRALASALAATTAIGLVGVSVTGVAGGPLVRLVGGQTYAGMGGVVWLFTALGVALALVQVLVYAGLAVNDVRLGRSIWVVTLGAAVVVAVFRHDDVVAVASTMLVAALSLVATGLALILRRGRIPPVEESRRDPAQHAT